MSLTGEAKQRAFALFDQNNKVSYVAKALQVSWGTAQTLRRKWEAQHLEPAETPVVDDGEQWTLSLTVAPADLDRILQAATEQEKANAVAFLLQARLNFILQPPEEDPS